MSEIGVSRRCPECGVRAVLLVQMPFEIEPDGAPSDETTYERLECAGKRGCGAAWACEQDYLAAPKE